MTTIPLNNWTINILRYGEESPLENHGAMEIGADDDNHAFWVNELFVHTYGLNGVKTACMTYINRKQQ